MVRDGESENKAAPADNRLLRMIQDGDSADHCLFASPYPCRGCVARIGGEVLWLAAERALDPIGEVFVAAVENLGEEFVQEPDQVRRQVLLR